MKLASTLVFAGLLLSASIAFAGVTTPTPEIDVPSQVEASLPANGDVAVAEADPCGGTEGELFLSIGDEDPIAPIQYCGSCSTSNCRGAARGQMCWTGNGWGHCNIFSGGYMCSTGGWDCQCSGGVLP